MSKYFQKSWVHKCPKCETNKHIHHAYEEDLEGHYYSYMYCGKCGFNRNWKDIGYELEEGIIDEGTISNAIGIWNKKLCPNSDEYGSRCMCPREKTRHVPKINFGKMLRDKVEQKLINCTIRPNGLGERKVGGKLYFYTGGISKYTRKLGEGICTKTTSIYFDGNSIQSGEGIIFDNEDIAKKLGYNSWEQLVREYKHFTKKEFNGQLIEWIYT